MKDAYNRLMQPEDVFEILNMKLRESDIKEIEACTGHTSKEALEYSIISSKEVYVIIYADVIVGVFGIGHPMAEKPLNGVVWLLATDVFDKYAYRVARQSKGVIARWKATHNMLFNFVSSENTTSIKWLKWLGFGVGITEYYFKNLTVPFYLFKLIKE